MAAHLLWEVGPAAGSLGSIYAATLGLALVYLGEHYAVDLLAGAALTETIRSAAPRFAPIARRLTGTLRALELRAGTG
jgi:membrane-associated phospholipid phosphatase